MSLFDFFKPKKNETNEMFERMDFQKAIEIKMQQQMNFCAFLITR